MFGKRVKAVIVAVVVALILSVSAPLSGGPSVVVLAEGCETSGGTCP
ncbi:MAG: hypothetical protein GY832_24385 [Chloroflexi bacterium]|nr:hypothetical protein [Chloroflexota bacterium]